MSGVETLKLDDDAEGERLDRWFKRHFPGLPYGQLQRLLRGGQIRLDGRRVKSSTRLAAGQRLRVPPLESTKGGTPATGEAPGGDHAAPPVSRRDQRELRRRVLYRDDWLIAIDKPEGLAVQGGSGQRRHIDAMLEALRFDAAAPPRLVHRLDKDTSGVLLLARHVRAARALTKTFRDKSARKVYWAAVAGRPPKRRGVISLPLGKEGTRGAEKVKVEAHGARPAQTLYLEVSNYGRAVSWLLLMPLTGRTHQLRVHTAAIDMPILGDGKYGGRAAFPEKAGPVRRLMLHAREIDFPHPEDGTTLRIRAPVPPTMEEAWQRLGFDPEREPAALHDLIDYAANFV
jgi:23S rRNA pseudouridine955/2504/2580 synthase